MPTLPLYDFALPGVDDSRCVMAPGGYECWRFDAESAAADGVAGVRVVAELWDGYAFDPAYVRRYALYRRFPTRVRPPLPREHRWACLTVFEAGKVLAKFRTRVPEGETLTGEGQVRLGANHWTRGSGGAMRVLLRGTVRTNTWMGQRGREDQTLTAELFFRPGDEGSEQNSGGTPKPRRNGVEVTPLSREISGADHRWIVSQPRCAVEGEITLFTGAGAARVIPISGLGIYDHSYGSGSIASVRGPCWLRGRLIEKDRTIAFSHLAGGESVVVESADDDVSVARDVVTIAGEAGQFGMRCPAEVRIGETLLLNPRVVDPGFHAMTVMYDAARGGLAWCEIVFPRRLRWRVAG